MRPPTRLLAGGNSAGPVAATLSTRGDVLRARDPFGSQLRLADAHLDSHCAHWLEHTRTGLLFSCRADVIYRGMADEHLSQLFSTESHSSAQIGDRSRRRAAHFG